MEPTGGSLGSAGARTLLQVGSEAGGSVALREGHLISAGASVTWPVALHIWPGQLAAQPP